MSVRLGETEPGAAVRRPSDRSADDPGVPAWGGVWRPAPNDPHGLSSGQTSGLSVAGPGPIPRRDWLGILALPGQNLTQPLVLDDRRVADPLQIVEHRIGQTQSLPADLEPPVRKVVDLDLLTDQPRGDLRRMQRELHPVVMHDQLP